MNIKTANTILYCNKWKETVAFYVLDLKLTVLLDKKWFMELKLTESARLALPMPQKLPLKAAMEGESQSAWPWMILNRHASPF